MKGPSPTALRTELAICTRLITAHRSALLILAPNQDIPLQRARAAYHLRCLGLLQRYRHYLLLDAHEWGIVL